MLGRSASLAHSARVATGAAATLPAHLRDARGVTAATAGTRWTMMMRTMTTMEEVVAEAAGVGSTRGGTSAGGSS
jgi:hypothetical protein